MKNYPLLSSILGSSEVFAASKKVYVAVRSTSGGETYFSWAERKNNQWEIGGDYDYSSMVGGSIWDLTDKKAYAWNNGRLKFSDNLLDNQVKKALLDLKESEERLEDSGYGYKSEKLPKINELLSKLGQTVSAASRILAEEFKLPKLKVDNTEDLTNIGMVSVNGKPMTLEEFQNSKNLEVDGDLHLSYTKITSLPAGLKVGGYLNLAYTKITSLPAGLKVGGYLNLGGTPLTSLPAGLKVDGDLDLDRTKITSLQRDSRWVGGCIFMAPLSHRFQRGLR